MFFNTMPAAGIFYRGLIGFHLVFGVLLAIASFFYIPLDSILPCILRFRWYNENGTRKQRSRLVSPFLCSESLTLPNLILSPCVTWTSTIELVAMSAKIRKLSAALKRAHFAV